VGWITHDKLILTLNNEYYLVTLRSQDMVIVKHKVGYGIQ